MNGGGQRAAACPAGWSLVWSDEFDGPGLDASKWDAEIGNGFRDASTGHWVEGWGNEELQYYTRDPANLCVDDGCLVIRALEQSRDGCRYTSARIKTRGRDGRALFAKRYGRFEFRARVPYGKGLWPAIWLLPQDDRYGPWAASGEIDVMEIVGEQPQEYLGSLHFGCVAPKRALVTHVHRFPAGTVADFHVYAIEWEPGVIRWIADGETWAEENFWWSCSERRDGAGVEPNGPQQLNPWPAPFDQPFYIVMNVAVGGNFPGAPDANTVFPAELCVDYVRVYDRTDGYGTLPARGSGRLPFETPTTP